MNALRYSSRLYRNFGTSSKKMRDLAELKELQRQFQVDDGVPVYLKRGPRDKIFFSVVCLGLGVCLADALTTVYKLIYPPKPS
ncbi:cytochrome c oxidase subunit 7A1, mitochondrial-like [Argiope bruennichi]|uniref:cytochrome c oxidase subunit 7A1, mitochondrial-like n=1 Tax=Argiope bruennichi TaxID=94029 RepID=UPI0024959257|nr:cytochrome c oxidase subunit 7A1, mitochondrial-like [Argiope bruennichi]